MEDIRLHAEIVERLDSWEEGLYKSVSPLLQVGVLTSMYLKEIVEQIHKSGPELALTKDTVFLHARPHEGVEIPFIAFLHTEEPVQYFGRPIHNYFVFGAKDDDTHRKILARISQFVSLMRDDSSLIDEARFIRWFKTHED